MLLYRHEDEELTENEDSDYIIRELIVSRYYTQIGMMLTHLVKLVLLVLFLPLARLFLKPLFEFLFNSALHD